MQGKAKPGSSSQATGFLTSDGGLDRPPGPWVQPAPGVEPAKDAAPAEWLRPRLLEGGAEVGTPVGAVVPTGYAAYARILHPVHGPDDAPDAPSMGSSDAAWSGRRLHPEVQWERLIQPAGDVGTAAPWKDGPDVGDLPAVVAAPLVEVLRAHTATPERCWLCVWEGWGGWEDYAPEAARVELPSRGYLLMRAPIDAVVDGIAGGPREGHTGPSLWWPDDRTWCVATDIDFCWTYVAGSEACVHTLLEHPDLEALPTRPEHRGDMHSDTINPPPS